MTEEEDTLIQLQNLSQTLDSTRLTKFIREAIRIHSNATNGHTYCAACAKLDEEENK